MRYLIPLACLLLPACATVQNGATQAGNYMCANADSIRLGALATIQNAAFIADPVIRSMMTGSAQAQLTALESCVVGG